MRQQKRIKEFSVPRERVSPEVVRAFQDILVSLQNLDRAIDPEDAEDVAAIRTAVESLEKRIRRVEATPRKPEVVVRRSTEITYSSTFG